MVANGGDGKEFVEERVIFAVDQKHADQFIPRISVMKTIPFGRGRVEKSFRDFVKEDISRVLDFDAVEDPPPDGPMMHGEGGDRDMKFPKRHMCLRGGFIFLFDVKDVSGTGQSQFVDYNAPPFGVIPLNKVKIEVPPGGRRVFKEHAQTDARTGYEMAILHACNEEEVARPPMFIAADSLRQRDKWTQAIKARASIDAHTSLRAQVFGQEESFPTKPNQGIQENETTKIEKGTKGDDKRRKGRSRNSTQGSKNDEADGEDIGNALAEFGKKSFLDRNWIDNYFETHNDTDAEPMGKQLEQWQGAIKRGLKNAVLEQYEYFVEASGEMTKMGKEVVELKSLVETQVETIKEMKEIDFSSAIQDPTDENGSDGEDLFHDRRKAATRRRNHSEGLGDYDFDDNSSMSSYEEGDKEGGRANGEQRFRDPESRDGAIDVPSFLEDAAEEILAFAKESRYSDATELWAKAKEEVTDIMKQHEQPTDNFLTRKQYTQVQTLIESLDDLSEMISNRLVENLRRKNEALKQAAKRERSDPMAALVPSVSPTCLNDDSVALRLLVKLGKTQEAAIAYSARRSLLLLESLHERPLSGTGNVDLVIYAAQLSQSFFSCLAGAIEGFLDLFLAAPPRDKSQISPHSEDEGSIQTDMQNMRDLPAGALASIVLWCDAELSKFAAAFGGTRVLGNLALSPPPRETPQRRGPRVLGNSDNTNKDRKSAIEVAAQCIGQAFQYASENLDTVGLPLTPRLAESLRKRLKGCEAEVSKLLDDHWRAIVLDWEIARDDEDTALDERRGI